MDISVSWNANSEPDLKDYEVKDGPSTGNYTTTQYVTGTSVTLSGRPDGVPWFVTVAGRDLNDLVGSQATPQSLTNSYVKVR